MKQWFSAIKLSVLFWSVCSPDLNHLGNVGSSPPLLHIKMESSIVVSPLRKSAVWKHELKFPIKCVFFILPWSQAALLSRLSVTETNVCVRKFVLLLFTTANYRAISIAPIFCITADQRFVFHNKSFFGWFSASHYDVLKSCTELDSFSLHSCHTLRSSSSLKGVRAVSLLMLNSSENGLHIYSSINNG